MVALVLAVLSAGCGSEEGNGLRGARAVTATVPALRADLAATLGARVWLTTLTARTSLLDGDGSPTAGAARAVLDEQAVDLADRVSRQPAALLTLLRRQDGLWAERARATAAGKDDARESIRLQLVENRTGIARLLAAPGLSKTTLQRELEPGYASLAAAVDAVARGRANALALTARAAARATAPAQALASAAKRRRPSLAGRPFSPAAELASLSAVAFTDAAYAQASTDALITSGASPGARLRSATRTLRGTADTLARLITSIYGDDLGGRFGKTWNLQAGAFTDYARGKTEDDAVLTERSLRTLDRLGRQLAVLLDEGDPDGSGKALAGAFTDHTAATTAAIRAQATRSPLFAERIVATADSARALGRELAKRVARQQPGRFPAG